MARGDRVFSCLAAMMDASCNIELIRQPGNTSMFKILDLVIWQATQLEVDKMNKDEHHREPELVKACKKTKAPPPRNNPHCLRVVKGLRPGSN